MGSVNNRRLYAAGLVIAAVGFVLDRTIFSEDGPGAAVAQTSPAAEEKPKAAASGTEPSQAAITALVAKLKALEESRPVGPAPVRDVFTFAGDSARGSDVHGLPATPLSGAIIDPEAFKAKHRLNAVLLSGSGPSFALIGSRRFEVGDELDGLRLVSMDKKNGGSAVFEAGQTRVTLIVPTGINLPKSDSAPADRP